MRLVNLFLLTCLALAWPFLALAQETAVAAPPASLGAELLQTVAAALIALLAGLLTLLVKRLLRWVDRKTSLDLEADIGLTAARVVQELEQTARARIAKDLADGKLDADEAKAAIDELGKRAKECVLEAMQEKGGLKGVAGHVAEKMAHSAVEAAVKRLNLAKAVTAPAPAPEPAANPS